MATTFWVENVKVGRLGRWRPQTADYSGGLVDMLDRIAAILVAEALGVHFEQAWDVAPAMDVQCQAVVSEGRDEEGIDPNRLYTVAAVMRHAGIGSSSLAEARASGIVTPVMAGGRPYYDGAELIAWIKASHVSELTVVRVRLATPAGQIELDCVAGSEVAELLSGAVMDKVDHDHEALARLAKGGSDVG